MYRYYDKSGAPVRSLTAILEDIAVFGLRIKKIPPVFPHNLDHIEIIFQRHVGGN